MQVLLVVLALVLPLDCAGFSWPRQTKETIAEGAAIPQGLSNLGGLDLDRYFCNH